MIEKYNIFQDKPVAHVESYEVQEGVSCEVYEFKGDSERDLAIISVDTGKNTPLQEVVVGDKTIEGYLSGKGVLTVHRLNGDSEVYEFPDDPRGDEVEVRVGDRMQWKSNENLVFYEICEPPYSEGRFENLDEDEL